MRFFIIDDHPMLRTSLSLMFQQHFPHCQVEEASDAESASLLLGEKAWDVIILDLDLPDRSGVDFLREIVHRTPKARILVYSGCRELDYGPRILKAGAAGFLHKAAPQTELLVAIRRILDGKMYISQELAASLTLPSSRKNFVVPHESLSGREFEVLHLFGVGCPSKEIANRLGLSVKTVSTYRTRLLLKLGLRTTGEIVRYAVHNKF